MRVIIAGGGTGGHIFPAIAIANALKEQQPGIDILFVGAKGKMEMDKVPQAGYKIVGLDIAGFNRSSLIKNIGLPFKLVKSFLQVKNIFKGFKPDAVIGVGGYSSFPVLRYAQAKGIHTFIHESNSFAGKSNILLGKKATKVFTGTDGMEKFFPAGKIMITGNPVRSEIARSTVSREDGIQFFGLLPQQKTVLVVGGSLGAKSINETIDRNLEELLQAGLQVIWQTGKPYAATARARVQGKKGVWVNDFITDMQMAYAAADMIVARAGAMTVAEICVVQKPALFVPYPYAAEDHQTANAKALVDKGAAVMVKDTEALTKAIPMLIELSGDEPRQLQMKTQLAKLAITDADTKIAKEVLTVTVT